MRDELGFLHVPFIIHIHELENVLLILLTTQTLYGFQHWPDQYISCTPSVAKILSETYQVDPGKISTIGEFISPPVSGTIPTKAAARERLHMDPGTFIVMSFGAINYRKGSDLFIQTATVLKKMGFTSFHFYWFGENQWDIEAPLWNSPSWESCLQELAACGLTDQVTFMGPTDNIYDYLPAADLFYLPSREDPLPLVALEASLAGVTTLCFENSGGIPLAFGPDNVLTVEKENISDAARKIIEIALNPEFFTTYGRRASQLVRENFISDTVVPKIYSLCRETMKNKASGSGQANAAGGSDRSFRWTFITTNDGSFDGGSEKLWVQSAIRCQQNGDDVSIVIKKWDPLPSFIQTFVQSGIAVIFKSDDPYRALLDFHPDLVVISIGDQDEGVEWYDFCRVYKYPFVIVNQLTKEPSVWPVNKTLIPGLTRGHMAATRVLFTGQNNLRLMERRLGVPIPQAGIFFNPVDTDRDQAIPYPDSSNGLQIAIIGSLLDIHKGQSLAIRLMNLPKWKNRPLTLHLYGQGPDEAQFRSMAEKFQLNNVVFHGHVTDIPAIWKVNHLLLMSSLMEGLPLVLVSAMMAGRAAVVTDIGAHAEVIDDDRTGFLASEPTVEALDQALERAWIRRHEWHQMGLDARAFIGNIFRRIRSGISLEWSGVL
jgi:glycosyltransferase involved in cell wall biosynthesis